MTAYELRDYLDNKYALGKWPEKFEVDYETYVNVCNEIFTWSIINRIKSDIIIENNKYCINIWTGRNHKILFKDIELIPVK